MSGLQLLMLGYELGAHPEDSNQVIADRVGCSEGEVARARDALGNAGR